MRKPKPQILASLLSLAVFAPAVAQDLEGNTLEDELIDRFGLLPEGAKNLMRIAAIKKSAARLGIEKSDVADAGGYFVFGPDSRVDPLALIQLVQSESQQYRLQGSHRLQIRQELGALDKRFDTIENLLDRLAVKEGSDA